MVVSYFVTFRPGITCLLDVFLLLLLLSLFLFWGGGGGGLYFSGY